MLKLICTKCKYQFHKEKIPSRCPYCANDNTVQIQKTSQEILDESIQEMDVIKQSKREREG